MEKPLMLRSKVSHSIQPIKVSERSRGKVFAIATMTFHLSPSRLAFTELVERVEVERDGDEAFIWIDAIGERDDNLSVQKCIKLGRGKPSLAKACKQLAGEMAAVLTRHGITIIGTPIGRGNGRISR